MTVQHLLESTLTEAEYRAIQSAIYLPSAECSLIGNAILRHITERFIPAKNREEQARIKSELYEKYANHGEMISYGKGRK